MPRFTKERLTQEFCYKLSNQRLKSIKNSLYSYLTRHSHWSVPWDIRNSDFLGYDIADEEFKLIQSNIVLLKKTLQERKQCHAY